MSAPYSHPTHLIIVCCHAIYLGDASQADGGSLNEANWLIEPFQVGETETYVKHVEAGVRELAENKENSILVFSGAATKSSKTAISEGEGYLNVALEHNLFNLDTDPPSLRPRLFVDRYATDSYQNVQLPLLQFPLFIQQLRQRLSIPSTISSQSNNHSMSGLSPPSNSIINTNSLNPSRTSSPGKITIISHAFKRPRFLDLHIPALGYPLSQTAYIGIDPPFEAARMAEIEEGEHLRGYGAWEKDPHGVGELLEKKRQVRGWDEKRFNKEVLERLERLDRMGT